MRISNVSARRRPCRIEWPEVTIETSRASRDLSDVNGADDRGCLPRHAAPPLAASEPEAVERVQPNVNEQSKREQACALRDRKQCKGDDRRLGMQRVKVDAAAVGVVDRVGQKMVEVDEPTGE